MAKSDSPSVGDKPKAVGRPPKLTPAQRKAVYDAFKKYIDEEEDPTLVGFVAWNKVAIKHDVTRDNINDWPEFSTLIKRGIVKQEAYLIKMGSSGKGNPAFTIFRLKQPQHGYSDRQQVEGDHELTIVTRRHNGNKDNGDGNADD